MVDALKRYNSLITGYQKAFSNKKGQEIRQEVSKLWKEMKKENKTLQGFSFSNRKKNLESGSRSNCEKKENYFLFGIWYAYLVLYKI